MVRFKSMSGNGTLASVCALAVWLGGCPKRQGPASAVVYVPAQAVTPAPSAAANPPDVLVIEEPAPPPTHEEAGGGAASGAATQPTTQRRVTHPKGGATTPTEPDDTATQESPETPPAEVPALEPRESSAQETVLRGQAVSLQENVRQRISRLNPAHLSPNEKKTLEDAGTFLAQSTRAFESGDFQRALNLARKASLLVDALE